MTLFLSFSIIAVLAFAVVAYRAVSGMHDSLRKANDTMESLASALAQTKGLTPHQAAPKVYSPGGVSWDAVERGRETAKAQANAPAIAATKADLSKLTRAIAILEDRQRLSEPVDEGQLKDLRVRHHSLSVHLKQLEEVNG